jgi:predicted transglutaminase-like cysteine proteinase
MTSSVMQNRRTTHRSASRSALWRGLLLVAAVGLLSCAGPTVCLSASMPIFDSGAMEAASLVDDRTNTASLEPELSGGPDERTASLFGMETEPLLGGTVLEKWRRAQAEISGALEALDRCRAIDVCAPDAQRLIDLSAEGAPRSGRAKVGLINRAVNLAISPVSDEAQWGVPDHWSAPFETLRSGRGDCEDYAIVKYLALLEAGVAKDDVKIVILKNVFPNEDHAVMAVRVDDQWLILDNRTLTLVRDIDLTRAIPEFMLDQGGVKRFVSGSRTQRAAG